MKVTFVTNQEKGTTTCIATNCSMELIKDLGMDATNPANCTEDFLLSDTYVGVARLKGDDIWNEEIGVQVASDIVQKKLNQAKFKKMTHAMEELEATLDFFQDFRKYYLTK